MFRDTDIISKVIALLQWEKKKKGLPLKKKKIKECYRSLSSSERNRDFYPSKVKFQLNARKTA